MSRLLNAAYNLDRVIASLGGAAPQETISSEVGRVARGQAVGHFALETAAAKWLARRLDTDRWLWGQEHTRRAIEHADRLNAVDDGREQ